MIFSKELFWSTLKITVNSINVDNTLINRCFDETKDFENNYSRFIKWNFLYYLNKNKSSQVSWELLSILNLSNKVSELTDWYFDITVLPFLENIWYWIFDSELKENIWYKNIKINNNKVTLENWISIDIWAVWKWYIVDKIYNTLNSNYDDFTINFGGDIRVKWTKKILLEDPLNEKKSIWSINISDLSIASSTPFKRKTNKWHHLINPINWKPQNDKLAIYITHKLSSFSDIFSTALFVTPLDKALKIINKINWLEAMIIAENWEIYKSKWFNCNLNK